MYNLDPIYGANNTAEIIQAVNTASGNWLVSMLIFALWLIIVIRNQRGNMPKNTIVSCYVMVFICLIASLLEWISFTVLIVPIILMFVSIFIYKFVG